MIYDFFVQTPLVKHQCEPDFCPVVADFGDATQQFHIGAASIATPGMVKGAFAIYQDLCTLPLAELMAPAIRLAKDGVAITAMQAYVFDVVSPIYRATHSARQTFVGPGGDLPREGDIFQRPELASTLDALLREGEQLFYAGEMAETIAASCREGGYLTREDLVAYEIVRREPLAFNYRSTTVLTNPPPTFGGLLIAFALQLLESAEVSDFGSHAHLGLLAKIIALTQKARLDSTVDLPTRGILETSYISRYQQEVADYFACTRGTTHISVVDSQGAIASMSLSNGEGCGAMVEDTGFMLNNMLGEEDINPGGFGRWQPDRRVTSMMAPTVLTTDSRRYVLGSGGSNRIRSAILQVVSNLVDFEMDLTQAVDSPRIHVEQDELNVEKGFTSSVITALGKEFASTVLWQDLNLFFGGVHAVEISDESISAHGDSRRGGVGLIVR